MSTRVAASICLAAALLALPGHAEDAESIFDRHSDSVVRVVVQEISSGAKAIIGSGFFVSEEGLVATNYHVLSRLVRYPDRYEAQIEDSSGRFFALRLVAVDVVHDLALAVADGASGEPLAIASQEPPKGMRLWAFGFPHDLGLSIIEGTHNGLIEDSVYEKLHFTASVNPGMSGGPVLERGGRVVGINVASSGNQISFLVPSSALSRLVSSSDQGDADNLLDQVRQQMLQSQNEYIGSLLSQPLPTVAFGDFQIPSEPSPAFRCWADAQLVEDRPYHSATHRCSTEDYVYLSDGHWAGIISLRHDLISSDDLNVVQFSELYTTTFSRNFEGWPGREEDVTRYRCVTDIVELDDRRFKVVFCLRAYKDLPGLYDVIQKSAILGTPRRGLVSTLVLAGVSYENGRAMARRFLEAIRWDP